MTRTPAVMSTAAKTHVSGWALNAQARETDTGTVFLVGAKADKVETPQITDLLDFSTREHRQRVCQNEVALNRLVTPDGCLGLRGRSRYVAS